LARVAFHDPVAVELLSEEELVPVRQVREGTPPQGWAARLAYESVRGSAGGMAPRTVAIDAALRDRPVAQLVVLGAGLDDRAWRMPELGGADVYEVDHPDSQRDKQERVAHLVPVCRSLHFVAVDLAWDPLGPRLAEAGHDRGVPTTWLWEGVVAYLTPSQVTETLATVARLSAPGSRMVVNYQSPSWTATVGRQAARVLAWTARQQDVWRREPRRSAWRAASMRSLLERNGFLVVSDTDLLSVAEQLSVPPTHPRSLRSGRVAVADWTHR
jgi:methyltransferase (TIGR00027 family)